MFRFIPNFERSFQWKGLRMLLIGGNINAGAINFMDGYQKTLYPIINSLGDIDTATIDDQYCASLLLKVATISSFLSVGLVATPTKVLILFC